MKKKTALPDSLELLLDTMCNTFGGIMFIAIALVIISQLISRTQLAMTPEEIDKANIARMQANISACRMENLELQKQLLNMEYIVTDDSPEKAQASEELKEILQKKLIRQNKIEELEQKIAVEQRKVTGLALKIQEQQQSLNSKKQQIATREKTLLEQERETAVNVKELEKQLANFQPRSLRFSMEQNTSLKPYWVLLKQNRIYRWGDDDTPVQGEVRLSELPFRRVKFVPLQGTSLSEKPETELDYLFKNIDRNTYFIRLVLDNESFGSLVITKQYFRDKSYMVGWSYNPEYEFVSSSNVQYRASH